MASRDDARRSRAAAVALLLIVLAFVATGPSRQMFNAVRQVLFPGRVTLRVAPGNVRVKSGSSLVINARLVNAHEDSAQVEMGIGGQWRTLEMAVEGEGAFSLRLEPLAASVTYRVLAGGLTSPTYGIEVVFPPLVTSIDLEYQYPSGGTGRTRLVAGTADIAGPPGTEVRVHVHTDRPATAGHLALAGGETFPLTQAQRTEMTAVLRVDRDTSYRVALSGPDGLTSLDDSRHTIRALARSSRPKP